MPADTPDQPSTPQTDAPSLAEAVEAAHRHDPPAAQSDAVREALRAWQALPEDERNGERPFVFGFNEGWDVAIAALATPPAPVEGVEDNAFLAASRERFGITREEQLRRARKAADALRTPTPEQGERQSKPVGDGRG